MAIRTTINCCMALMILVVSGLHAQDKECKEEVVASLHDLFENGQDEVDIMYKIGTRMQGTDTTLYQNISMQVSGSLTKMESDLISYYKNEKIAITVDHGLKRVIISNGKGMNISKYVNSFITIYDQMLENANVRACYEVCDNDSEESIIELTLPETEKLSHDIRGMSYSLVGGKLKRLKVDYKNSYPIATLSLEIGKWQALESKLKFEPDVQNILLSPHLVESQFKGYRIADNRPTE
ncbi:MAG: hypothetical protein AAFN93_15195 [Bacteroidota bacterium]